MKKGWLVLSLILSVCWLHAEDDNVIDTSAIELDDSSAQMFVNYLMEMDSINNSFTYDTTGSITLGDGLATFVIPQGFKYVSGKQADYILHDIWGNPPQSGSLGMIFPSHYGPADYDSWAIDISFEEEGYIDDADAAEMDYDELETELKKESVTSSRERDKAGYGKMLFLGWAKQPFYDSANKKLHWAMKYDTDGDDLTLNYNIRMLGRRGYLVLNIIGGVNQLEEIEPQIETLLSSVNFNDGHAYKDFDPEYDKVAAYGIGALVAGKVLAKAGFWVAIAKFWKVIAFGAVAAGAAIKKFFFGGNSEA